MNERKFNVVGRDNVIIASRMTIENTLIFVKAYLQEHYNDKIIITEMAESGGENK